MENSVGPRRSPMEILSMGRVWVGNERGPDQRIGHGYDTRMGWDIFFRGKFVSDRRPRSIKFPVALESIKAVISTICFPMNSLTGK